MQTIAMALCAPAALLASLLAPGGSAQAVADFAAVPPTGTEALTVQFENLSSPDTFYWLWSFGDGSSSLEYEPLHVYGVPGSYSVSLSSIGVGLSQVTKVGAVHVLPAVLQPAIWADPAQGFTPLSVQFTDVGPSDHAQQWSWDFGDGCTSNDASPVHVYWQAGLYDVSLAVAAGTNAAQVTTRGVVSVESADIMRPAFDAAPTWGGVPLEVEFGYDGEGVEPDGFLWDFGDGSASTARDPMHVYTSAGDHDVSLTTTLGRVTEGVFAPAFVHATMAQITFGELAIFASPPGLVPFALVDATSDGLPDVLAAGHELAVFAGGGDGSLGEPLVQPVDGELLPPQIDVGDLDHDGRVDIVGLRRAGDGVSHDHRLDVFLGGGDGTFAPGAMIDLDWPYPYTIDLVLGDFVSDGTLDLVASHTGLLSVFPGDGSGGFLPPLADQPEEPFFVFASSLTAADFDLDGLLDLHSRYSTDGGSGGAVVYLGDGAGHFTASCGASGQSFGNSKVGEVDGDGMPDMISEYSEYACYSPGDPVSAAQLHVASWASGCPDFDSCADFAMELEQDTYLVEFVDVDGEWHDDLVGYRSIQSVAQTVVLPSIGGGLLGDPIVLPGVPVPRLIGDLDGNGRPDFVGLTVDGSLWVSRNLTPSEGWTNFGGGLAGAFGTPLLEGSDALPADKLSLSLADAAPIAPALLVIGLAQDAQSFHGGVLVPSADLLVPLVTDAQGGLALAGRLPPALGPGAMTWWQMWIVDAAGPAGASASNTLRHLVPTTDD